MTVNDLIKQLKGFNGKAKVFVSSDEELNTLFSDFEVAALRDDKGNIDKEVVIYGLSGSERF